VLDSPQPQKIEGLERRGAVAAVGIRANDWPLVGSTAPDGLVKGSAVRGNATAKGMSDIHFDGKSAHIVDMGNVYINSTNSTHSTSFPINSEDVCCDVGSVVEPILVSSDMTKEVSTVKNPVSTRGEFASVSLQGSIGIASSPMTGGKHSGSPCSAPNLARSTVSLSLIECPSDNMSARPTVEEVIAFGGIPKPSGVRTSKRLGCHADVDMPQMEKAMMNAQLRDVSACAGESLPPKFSIVDIPESEFLHRANKLGISLGKSQEEIVKSIRGIKLLEEERIITILQKNVNREEDPSNLVMSKVSTLCEDLIKDDGIPLDLDDHLEHLNPVINKKKTRVRKTYDTNNIRKSTRRRIKKQYS
jgi:hypothetical protein